MLLQRIVTNTATAVRTETLEGEEHIVAPLVLINEGVYTGSDGPIFYPDGTLSKDPSAWNHVPIVVYHPEMNGQPISARTPKVIEERRVGLVFNSGHGQGLKAEAWFNKKKTAIVDQRVLDDLAAGKPIEVSTGVFLEVDRKSGKHGGKDYIATVTDMRPDHLAVLPDKKGACSNGDGCGIFVTNEASFGRISEQLASQLYRRFDYRYDIRDVYTDFIVYRGSKGQLFKLPYSTDSKGVATLSDGEGEAVNWVTEYRTVSGNKFVGNCRPATPCKCKEINVDKKAQIDFLLTANCGWEEADRPTLEAMPDAKVAKLHDAAKTKAAPPPPEEKKPTNNAGQNPPPPAVPQLTPEQWRAAAPPGYLAVLDFGAEAMATERNNLVATITANANNVFTPQYLGTLGMPELRGMAKLATVPAAPMPTVNGYPMFIGQATAPTNNTSGPPSLIPPPLHEAK